MAIPGQSAILNIRQPVFVAKSPNLMYAECTTPTVLGFTGLYPNVKLCTFASAVLMKFHGQKKYLKKNYVLSMKRVTGVLLSMIYHKHWDTHRNCV